MPKNNYLVFKKQKDLSGVLNQISKIVDPVIKELLFSYVNKEAGKIIGYQVEIGGKRLRPALAVMVCLACGGKIKDALYPAAGLEILHENSLIIDDIIDHSLTRRGKPTCWKKFGQSIAECLSFDYSASIFQSVQYSKKPEVVSDVFSRTIKFLVNGEILDILFEQAGRKSEKYVNLQRYKKIGEKDYFRMVKGKTAALVEACCEIGAVSAETDAQKIKALKNYGRNLGLAFQMRDDILDIFGDQKKFGKKIGKDIEESKLGNILIYFALEELAAKEKKELLAVLKKDDIKQSDINKAIILIKKTKAKEKALSFGEKFVKMAKKDLAVLPNNKWKKILEELADFMISREN